MDYAMIGKIEKAKMYAEEREQRIDFESFRVRINGDNSSHYVEYNSGNWHCDCEFFASRGHCSHTMAMERVLENMVELAF
ncbi:MAG: hypothetical protein KC418_00445 [Anaerolineales bacterium]|nr:hypothetical protein [Anaerolineales bacterium]MCB8954418.1 hypothetical protein [Ardenticatenales bacterium]